MKVRDAVMARIHELRERAAALAYARAPGEATPATIPSAEEAAMRQTVALLEAHVGTTYHGFIELEVDHALPAAMALVGAIAAAMPKSAPPPGDVQPPPVPV